MSSDQAPEVIASYAVKCRGLIPLDLYGGQGTSELAKSEPVDAAVTVYKDGTREVACPCLATNTSNYEKGGDLCAKLYSRNLKFQGCLHLRPTRVQPDSKKVSP